MLLVIDVGNTNTVLGLYAGPTLRSTWRVSTSTRTADELGVLLVGLFRHHDVDPTAITGVALCTVVPAQEAVYTEACARYLGQPVRVYGAGGDFGMPVTVDSPAALGPDRVVNALAVAARHAPPFLVIDFGTATTFDAVDATGTFVGGAIAPGLGIAAEALFSRTSRLPRVDLRAPPHAIGTNTVAAMQSGLYYGYVGLVDGLAARCKAELGGGRVPCVATGGLARVVAADCHEVDEVDATLTLTGLRIWYENP